MVDGDVLERAYQERLEENIIMDISDKLECSLDKAMDVYYSSRLSEKIHQGLYGIQYLDHKNLAEILINAEIKQMEN